MTEHQHARINRVGANKDKQQRRHVQGTEVYYCTQTTVNQIIKEHVEVEQHFFCSPGSCLQVLDPSVRRQQLLFQSPLHIQGLLKLQRILPEA